MALKYRKPKIKKPKDNKWFVEYYFFDIVSMKYKRFKVYEDINKFQGKERNAYAIDLRDAVLKALEMGYNPFANPDEDPELNKTPLKIEDKNTIVEILQKFRSEKVQANLSERTLQHYDTFINHVNNWLKSTNNENKSIEFLDESKINEHMKYMQKLKKWRGNTYNNHRDMFVILFNWLYDNDFIEKKLNVKKLITMKSDTTRNEYYHGEVRERVKAELKLNPELDRYCRAIYYTCLRPYEELCQIKIEDIDFKNRVIKIKTHVGKTGYRHVPICIEFEEMLLKELKINSYDKSYYIFSKHAMPGPERVSKNYYTTKYKSIKQKLELGDEYTMYSWKHTRVTDLLMNGFTDAEVMDLTGHRDTSSYDHYKRNLGQKINSKIKGVTMDF